MVSIIGYIAIIWICVGFGAWTLRRLRAAALTLAEEIPFGAAIGMGTLSYLVLAAGLLGYVRLPAVAAMLVILAAISWRDMLRLAARLPSAIAKLAPWRRRGLALAIFLLVMFLLTLTGALAPATDNDYDSLVYHLTMPKLYVRDGGIHAIPWLTHSNFPFTIEMLYTVGLLARDQSLAKLLHFGCGWLTVLAVFGFARRHWGSLAGWLGACILAAVPLVAWQMTTAYIELGLALFVFLALAALARVMAESRESRVESELRSGPAGAESSISNLESRMPLVSGWLWVAALMCGWAMGTKMFGGVVFVFALVVLLVALVASSRGNRRVISPLSVVAFAAVAAAIASPWYIKSYLWTGNPVYPFFYGLFDGRFWTAERAQEYDAAQKAFGMGGGPVRFVLLPWNLTMHPRWFFDLPSVLRPFNVYVTVFGPLFLALLPTFLLTGPVGPAGRLVMWFGFGFGALWFVSTQNGRYLIPILPGLSACCGAAAARLLRRGWIVSTATSVALSLALAAGLIPTYMVAAPALPLAVGAESQSEYLMRFSPTYRLFKQIEAATPSSARIMLLGDEPRTFYLDRDCLLGDHADIFSRADLSSGPALLQALRRMGVTHLLLGAIVERDMNDRRGTIETRLAGLAASRDIVPVGQYDSRFLWRITPGAPTTQSGG